uniref:galactokinase family protein n=1 Tax=Nocardioides sp. TaxID=35761 RepID=UPI003564CD27
MTFADPGTAGDLVASVRHGFRQAFGRDCSVVARAPGRVNLIGEHTDYNAGPCLPLALPHATFAGAAARADGRVRLTSAQTADAWEGDLAD